MSRYKQLLVLAIAMLMTGSQASARQAANFELAEKFSTENINKMSGDLRVFPRWLKNSDKFWYSYKTSEGRNFYIVDPARRSKNALFDNDHMASELTKLTNKPYNAKDLTLRNLKFSDDQSSITFEVDSLRFDYNMGSTALSLKDTVKNNRDRNNWKSFAPDSSWIVFAKNHNLFLMKPNDPDSTEIQLTTDGEKWYSFNANDSDTSTTKRVRARATWFRDSKKFYVRRQDRRKVGDLFVINSLSKPRPTLQTYKYPMPGEKNIPQDELIVFNPEARSRVEADVAKWKDQSLGGVYFGSGGFYRGKTSNKLYFIRRDRTWSKIDLCELDTETGNVRVLIEEVSKPYFNTRYARLDILNGGSELIWFSERDGWGHLYLYDGDGNLKRKLTDGTMVVGRVTQIDTTGRQIYFEAYGREKGIDPYYSMQYKVGLDGKKPIKLLTPENGTHSFSMSKSNKYFVSTYSRIDEVPKSVLKDSEGKVILELETTDISQLLEAGYKMPETFEVKAADGVTPLYGVMWKPFDFDPEKKYPIITYVYPGPQSEPVPKTFLQGGSRLRNVPLSQVGFVVVAVGQRGGSPQRSKYYHNFGYGNARDYALADNKAALEQLANRHEFIDINKVGIYGHSGGGFMSTAAMLVYPDFYKVAVSSAGNHDNNIYNIWWGEVHYGVKEVKKKKKKEKVDIQDGDSNGSDQEEKEEEETVFEAKIPTNWEIAKNLKGHLLLVHGDIDNNVHPAGTTRVVDALIKAGKRFDYMVMPGKRHGFGNYTKYFERMMWYYFGEHLLGDYRNNVEIYNPDKK